ATSANLGPGFDVLGVALHLFNEVHMEAQLERQKGAARPPFSVSVDVEGEGMDQLPRDESNLVVRAAWRVFDVVRLWPRSLHVKLINRIPLSRGLGSSAAATLAGVVGANYLCGNALSEEGVLKIAVAMEGHPDNIVPALAGGFCVSGVIQDQV